MSIQEKTILIIDDDAKLIDLLGRYLRQQGWNVLSATSANAGLLLFKSANPSPSLVILDVMMPEFSGVEVLRQIRGDSETPVILLTAREGIQDRIQGLKGGADDYVAKPVDPGELSARIESILRRSQRVRYQTTKTEIYYFKNLEINASTRSAILNGEELSLTTTEFKTLLLFATNHGKILTRDAIMDSLRGESWNAYQRSIDILMSRLRQKLGDNAKNPKYLKTVWGEGYVFVAEKLHEKP